MENAKKQSSVANMKSAKKQSSVAKKILKVLLIILGALLALCLAFCIYAYFQFHGKVANVSRISDNNDLYYCEYTGEYENNLVALAPLLVQKFGCSCFSAHNENGNVITGRNYDFNYYDDEGNLDNLAFLMRIDQPGKYKSLNFADAKMLSFIGIDFDKQSLNEGEVCDTMSLFAYLCMDGINEKGLSIAALNCDYPEWEDNPSQNEPGKEDCAITQIIRHTLDYCATVDEAIEYAKSINYKTILKMNQHLLVTDAEGNSAVLEWREGEFYVARQDLVTNFYVNFDDGQDFYKKGVLREKFVEPVSKYNKYRYGYGHAFDRFAKLLERLDNHRSQAGVFADVTSAEAMQILSDVSQVPVPENKTSNTIYSVVYNNSNATLEVCASRDYEHKYSFAVE